MLHHNIIRDLGDERLPIRRRNRCLLRDFLTTAQKFSSAHASTHPNQRREREPYFCACTASNINNALLKFLPLSLAIRRSKASTTGQFSLLPTFPKTLTISSSLGAATRTNNVRLLIGAIIPPVVSANKTSRRLGLYFSIVRLNALCASRVK